MTALASRPSFALRLSSLVPSLRPCIRAVATTEVDDGAMQFSKNDALRIDAILAQVARTEIMPRFQTLAAHQVKQKSSSFDLVTEADEAAEHAISNELRAAYPGCIIIGEEAAAKR